MDTDPLPPRNFRGAMGDNPYCCLDQHDAPKLPEPLSLGCHHKDSGRIRSLQNLFVAGAGTKGPTVSHSFCVLPVSSGLPGRM